MAGVVDSQSPDRPFAHANSTQYCRREKPFFRRGGCVLKAAHHLEGSENIKVPGMKRWRLGLAVAGVAVCAIACALLWPRARDAGAILAAQDDPAAQIGRSTRLNSS